MGVHPQAWPQDQTHSWNWSADATEFTPGEPLNGEQFCGNGQTMAFFVPFPGSCGMGGMVGGVSMPDGCEPNSEVHEMEAKMAALQAENERLTQLYENECHLRQIEVTAYNQVFEMYAVPKAEAEEFARRLQVEGLSSVSGTPDCYQPIATVTGAAGEISMDTEVTGPTTPVTNGLNGNTTSVETLLKETFPHIKIHSLDEPSERKVEELVAPEVKTEEELEQHLCQLQGMVGCTIDERAKQTLLSLPHEHGKAALSKVEDIIHEQGGVCRNLSSMVQSVCRKVGHTAMKQWKHVKACEKNEIKDLHSVQRPLGNAACNSLASHEWVYEPGNLRKKGGRSWHAIKAKTSRFLFLFPSCTIAIMLCQTVCK